MARIALPASLRNVDPRRVDALVGFVLCAAIEWQVWSSPPVNGRLLPSVGGIVFGGAVLVRHRWPLAGVMVIMAVLALKVVVGSGPGALGDVTGVLPAVLLLTYGMGAFAPPRRSMPALAITIVVSSMNLVVTQGKPVSALVPSITLVAVLPYALGRRVRAQATRVEADREQAERIDADRDSAARIAALAERARIARELHDVVAHSVSVMVIQSGAARTVIESEPQRAEDALRNVERAGRDALTELRRLVGVLEGDGEPRQLGPPPGLRDLDGLVTHAQASGLDVAVSVEGQPVSVSPAVELCIYRVLQEALTNAIKHAAPAKADVRINWRRHSLDIDVSNTRQNENASVGVASGHGLQGMRERVAMHHGTLRTGATEDGGFVVHASLPLALDTVR